MADMQNASYAENEEISLLDILVILAESWKLLVFGPLLAGVFAGALSFLWPKNFESVAILRISEEDVALVHSVRVLDPLIVKFDLFQNAGADQESAREALKKRLVITTDRKTKLTTFTARAASPEAAQALAKDAISLLLAEQMPKGKEKAVIEGSIAINLRAINVAFDGIEAIKRSLKRGRLSDSEQDSSVKNLTSLNAEIARLSIENLQLAQRLELSGEDVYVQSPSFPQHKSDLKLGLVLLTTVGVSGFTLLLFVFMRKAWLFAAQDIDMAVKVNRIKKSFGLKVGA